MITMIKTYRIKNLEDELERLEDKIMNSTKVSIYDLQELEGLANEIMWLRYEMGND